MPNFELKTWQMMIVDRYCRHALTMLRMSDSNYNQKILFDWMKDCEALQTRRQAHYAIRRVSDLVLSSYEANERIELCYEEFQTLSSCFRIIEEIVNNPINYIKPEFFKEGVYNHTLQAIATELKDLSEAIRLLSFKIEDLGRQDEGEGVDNA